MDPMRLCPSSAWLALVLAGSASTCHRAGGPQDAGGLPLPSAEASPAPEPGPDASGPVVAHGSALVGNLVLNERFSITHPSEYCLDDGHVYAGAPARIGKRNLFTTESVSDLAGKVVVASGSHEPSLFAALRRQGTCPSDYGANPRELPQMRSDWVSPEGGFATTRAKLEKLSAFRARDLRVVSLGRELGRAEGRVVVELENSFAVALDTLSAVAHYEGGPGKPMPLREKITLSLPPGGTQRVELSLQIEAGPAGQSTGSPRGLYRLQSIDFVGQVGQFDFDASLWLGSKSGR